MRRFASVAVAVLGAAAAAAVWLRRRYVLVTVRGGSMLPTFHTGDRVLVRRAPLDEISQGAVVVVEQPVLGLMPGEHERLTPGDGLDRNWMIKRAAAVPGGPVPEVLAEALGAAPGDVVPPGRLAVLGDNADASFDSRLCGYIAESLLLGVAVRAVSRTPRQHV